MHPDLSPHLHTDECNKLIQELFACRKEYGFQKLFGKCNTPYDRMIACMKGERMARRDQNAKNAKEKQESIRDRVKSDNIDYDALLHKYKEEAQKERKNL